MEQDPPRRGPKIKLNMSWRMPDEVRKLAYRFIRAGIRRDEAIERNKLRENIGLLPLFDVKR